MALDNFIPEVWSANLQSNVNKAHVYAQDSVTNRDYEGDISQAGDTVNINAIGRVTIGNYTKNTNIGDPETLTSSQKQLVVDQQKYFNFAVDDVDKAQTKPKVMAEAMKESAYGLSDVEDLFLAGFHTGAAAANLIGNDTTPISVTTASDAYELLVDLGVLLDEQSIPSDGRSTVIPPWFHGLLQKDDRFVKNGVDLSVLKNGQVGAAAGFTILTSNNCPNTTGAKYKIQASHRMARSFAEQVVSTEAYRPEKRFGDAVKGLHVYGGKLARDVALAVLTANRT
jgi:P22 coat protein - gene protein 5